MWGDLRTMFDNGFFENVLSQYDTGSGDFLSDTTVSLSTIQPAEFFLCVGSALLIGFLISLVYMFTHRKDCFSQSYVLTMIMLPTVVSLILLLINTVAGALSLAGAFTLIRFRSVAGDPKDISYVFCAMAAGVACGIGYVGYAAVFFAVMGIIMCILSELNFGGNKKEHMTLKITIPEDLDYKGVFDPILTKYTSFFKLRRVKTSNFGTLFELIYSIDVVADLDQKAFIDELRTLNGNMNISLVMFKYDDKIYET